MQMDDFPESGEVLNIHLDQFIALAANDCGYSILLHNLMVNWVKPFF